MEESDEDEVTRLSDNGADADAEGVIIGLQTSPTASTVEVVDCSAAAELEVAVAGGTTHDDDGAAAELEGEYGIINEENISGFQTSPTPSAVGDAAEKVDDSAAAEQC
jgi:hypothetical protein